MSTVFVGATYQDLIEHRAATYEAIKELKLQPIGMESFGAQHIRTLDVCLREVRSSDVFVAIMGMRYGELVLDTDKSFTHHEIDEAISLELPILAFLIDEDKHLVAPRNVDIGPSGELLIKLKKRLSSFVLPDKFSSPADLKAKVLSSLEKLVGTFPQQREFYLKRGGRILDLFIDNPKHYNNLDIGVEVDVRKVSPLSDIEQSLLMFSPELSTGRMFAEVGRNRLWLYASGDALNGLKNSKLGKKFVIDCRTVHRERQDGQITGLEVLRIG
jgi:hypothetical protein